MIGGPINQFDRYLIRDPQKDKLRPLPNITVMVKRGRPKTRRSRCSIEAGTDPMQRCIVFSLSLSVSKMMSLVRNS